jgi:ribosomal protein L28
MKCEICEKTWGKGSLVSHSQVKTKHKRKPNLQQHTFEYEGITKSRLVCSGCFRRWARGDEQKSPQHTR